jgi:hypothetical protein
MKWLLFFVMLFSGNMLSAQHTEDDIRKLEDLERQAVLQADSNALFNRYWSPGMVVNTPANRVGTVEGTKAALRGGKLNYASFERITELIKLDGNTAVAMGKEVLAPQGQSDHAGKRVTRRYMNVWVFGDGSWKMMARQATIISVE